MSGSQTNHAAIPALSWIRGYDRSWLSRDIIGGLAAGAVVIPQAMAYATIADLPVEVGLYTCMVPMVVYALLGGSRTLSVSTTSTVAILTGSTLITAGVAAGSEDPARSLATLTVLVGLLLLVARLFRLGSLVDNISEATLTGIKAGVGLTVAAGQLPKVLGIDVDIEGAFFSEMAGVLDNLSEINWPTVALSIATIAILVGLARIAPLVPAPLVAVALGIALVAWWSVDDRGVALIDPIPSGLPLPVLPDIGLVRGLLGGAFAIGIMCFLETASVAGAVRRRDEPAIDNNQELAANGWSCVLGGFFRAMPSAGGFSQTAMNQRGGARTQLSELVTASLAVAAALFLGGVLSLLPEATLGSMVIVAVVGLIRPGEFLRYWRLDMRSFWVATFTAVAGLVFGLVEAVLVGVLLTLLLVLYEMNEIEVTELRPLPSGDDLAIASESKQRVPGLLILRPDAPLYTANVRRVTRQVLNAVDEANPRVVVLDLVVSGVISMTIVDAVLELEQTLRDQGVELWFASLAPRALETARRLPRWTDSVESGQLHETSLTALRQFERGEQ